MRAVSAMGAWSQLVSQKFFTANLVVFAAFTSLYMYIDMKKHFNVDNPTITNAMYFSAVAQSGTGFGDITPQTSLARRLVILHIVLTWLLLALLAIGK